MKPAAFDYIRAESVEEALDALSQHGDDARILAGGQSLMPMLNMRLARPSVIIDTSRLGGNASVSAQADSIVIAAGATQQSVLNDPNLRAWSPLLAAALPWVGHAQTRARGTICGSVVHADPSAEIPLCAAVLGAEIELSNRRGKRRVSSRDFHVGMMMTDRRSDEMVTAVKLPKAKPGEGFAFAEYGRRHGDFAIVACAAKASDRGVTLGVGGVADIPTIATWDNPEGRALEDALNAFAWQLGARDDIHADARMRRDLIHTLGRRTIEEARRRCSA